MKRTDFLAQGEVEYHESQPQIEFIHVGREALPGELVLLLYSYQNASSKNP